MKKKILSIVIILSILFQAVGMQVTETKAKNYMVQEEQDSSQVENTKLQDTQRVRIIVELEEVPTVGMASVQQAYAIDQATSRRDLDIEYKNQYSVVMNGFSAEATVEDAKELEKLPQVKKVYIANRYRAIEPMMINSPGVIKLTDELRAKGYNGKGTVVSIIDSGIDPNHTSFVLTDESTAKLTRSKIDEINASSQLKGNGQYFSAKIPYGYNYADNNTTIKDTGPANMHGIHVAGIVGANKKNNLQIDGIAPEAQLLAMKVFSNGPAGKGAYADDIIKAIEDSIILGADVINMSLGAPYGVVRSGDPEQLAVKKAIDKGVICVLAAGNLNSLAIENSEVPELQDISTISEPSIVRDAIAVASIQRSGLMSSFSSWGPSTNLKIKPEIAAPGGLIYSTLNDDSYGFKGGTSMASPQVAGAMAIFQKELIENYPDVKYGERVKLAKNIFMNTADPVKVSGKYVSIRHQGAGALNFTKALESKAIMTSGAREAKVELGDFTGTPKFRVAVTNTSDEAINGRLELDLIGTNMAVNSTNGGKSFTAMYTLAGANISVTPANQSIAPDKTAFFEVSIDVKNATVEGNKYNLNNYLEGFIYLKETKDGAQVDHGSIPLLGYYGDWDEVQSHTLNVKDGNDVALNTSNMILGLADGYNGSSIINGEVNVKRTISSLKVSVLDEHKNSVKLLYNRQRPVRKDVIDTVDGLDYARSRFSWDLRLDGKPAPEGTYYLRVSTALSDEYLEYEHKDYRITVDHNVGQVKNVEVVGETLTITAYGDLSKIKKYAVLFKKDDQENIVYYDNKDINTTAIRSKAMNLYGTEAIEIYPGVVYHNNVANFDKGYNLRADAITSVEEQPKAIRTVGTMLLDMNSKPTEEPVIYGEYNTNVNGIIRRKELSLSKFEPVSYDNTIINIGADGRIQGLKAGETTVAGKIYLDDDTKYSAVARALSINSLSINAEITTPGALRVNATTEGVVNTKPLVGVMAVDDRGRTYLDTTFKVRVVGYREPVNVVAGDNRVPEIFDVTPRDGELLDINLEGIDLNTSPQFTTVKGYIKDASDLESVTINGTTVTTSFEQDKNRWTFAYNYPIAQGTKNPVENIRIVARDKAGNESTLNREFFIDYDKPSIDVSDGQIIKKDGQYYYRFASITINDSLPAYMVMVNDQVVKRYYENYLADTSNIKDRNETVLRDVEVPISKYSTEYKIVVYDDAGKRTTYPDDYPGAKKIVWDISDVDSEIYINEPESNEIINLKVEENTKVIPVKGKIMVGDGVTINSFTINGQSQIGLLTKVDDYYTYTYNYTYNRNINSPVVTLNMAATDSKGITTTNTKTFFVDGTKPTITVQGGKVVKEEFDYYYQFDKIIVEDDLPAFRVLVDYSREKDFDYNFFNDISKIDTSRRFTLTDYGVVITKESTTIDIVSYDKTFKMNVHQVDVRDAVARTWPEDDAVAPNVKVTSREDKATIKLNDLSTEIVAGKRHYVLPIAGEIVDTSGIKSFTINDNKVSLVSTSEAGKSTFTYNHLINEDNITSINTYRLKAVDIAGNGTEITQTYFIDKEDPSLQAVKGTVSKDGDVFRYTISSIKANDDLPRYSIYANDQVVRSVEVDFKNDTSLIGSHSGTAITNYSGVLNKVNPKVIVKVIDSVGRISTQEIDYGSEVNALLNPPTPPTPPTPTPPTPTPPTPPNTGGGGAAPPPGPALPPSDPLDHLEAKKAVNRTRDNEVTIEVEENKKGATEFTIEKSLISAADKKGVDMNLKVDKVIISVPYESLNTGKDTALKANISSEKTTDLKAISEELTFQLEGEKKKLETKEMIKKPLTLRIPLTKIPFNKERVTIQYFNESTKVWESIGGMYNKETKTVDVRITQPGKFKVVRGYTSFKDTLNHWSREKVETLAVKGIINGHDEDNFKPNGTITYAEFIKLVVKTTGITVEQTDGKWYESYINAAFENKLINGKDIMNVEKPIPRDEMAKILSLVVDASKISQIKKVYLPTPVEFKDLAESSEEEKQNINKVAQAGLIEGDENGNFKPEDTLTRAEAATVIYRLLELIYAPTSK